MDTSASSLEDLREVKKSLDTSTNIYNQDREEYYSLEDVLEERYTKAQANKICEILSTCQCCDRHQQNRPSGLLINYNEYPPNTYGIHCVCKCKCRHYSRFLNRVFSEQS